MHRIDGPAAAPGNLFTEGDPGVGTPATVMTDDWANAVQEELCNVVTGAGLALSKPVNTQLLDAINVLLAQRTPPGAVQQFAMTAVPTGWLKCNGQVVSRTGYAALFAAIGTTWGAGDGSTTFAVPDLRGQFLRGWDDGRGVDAGRAFGSNQVDQLKSHTHQINANVGGSATLSNQVITASAAEGDELLSSSYILPPDAGVGAETRPLNVAIQWCIRT